MPDMYACPEEWYPVLCVGIGRDDDWPSIELTPEELADLRRVDAEFRAWQVKLSMLYGHTRHLKETEDRLASDFRLVMDYES